MPVTKSTNINNMNRAIANFVPQEKALIIERKIIPAAEVKAIIVSHLIFRAATGLDKSLNRPFRTPSIILDASAFRWSIPRIAADAVIIKTGVPQIISVSA